MSYSRTIIEGRLTRDPETKGTRDGRSIVVFSVACNRIGKDAPADFFDCVASGKQGENVQRYLKKGSRVLVEGRMQSKRYDDNSGKPTTSWGLNVSEVTFLGSADSGSRRNDGYVSTRQTVKAPRDPYSDMAPADDDDLPF